MSRLPLAVQRLVFGLGLEVTTSTLRKESL